LEWPNGSRQFSTSTSRKGNESNTKKRGTAKKDHHGGGRTTTSYPSKANSKGPRAKQTPEKRANGAVPGEPRGETKWGGKLGGGVPMREDGYGGGKGEKTAAWERTSN